jgi:DNA polymerase-1
LAKKTAFGLLYGMGDEKFAKQNKCSIEEAASGRLAFFGRYPIAKQWLFHIVREARRQGFVRSIFGRIRHLPGINSQDDMVRYEAEAAAKNSPIQGAASDYCCNAANRIVLKFKELGLHGKLRILIHDAILMDIPKSEFEQSIKIMKEEMERPVCNMVVPIKADFSIGPNWGEMKKYKFEKELQHAS